MAILYVVVSPHTESLAQKNYFVKPMRKKEKDCSFTKDGSFTDDTKETRAYKAQKKKMEEELSESISELIAESLMEWEREMEYISSDLSDSKD